MLALIGPNGAGKSTTFNMVGGQLRPDAGTIELAGVDIAGLPPRAIWQQGVGRTFQIAETFASLTVVENVQMALLSADRRLFSFWRARRTTGAPMRWRCSSRWAWRRRPTAPAARWPMAT
jgi:branched-chain amino acid transport system ATP-binding protein